MFRKSTLKHGSVLTGCLVIIGGVSWWASGLASASSPSPAPPAETSNSPPVSELPPPMPVTTPPHETTPPDAPVQPERPPVPLYLVPEVQAPQQGEGGGPEGGGPEAPIFDANTRRISFQAVLTNNAGQPLPGPVNLRFQIYTSPGGVAVGAAIDVNGVAVNNGVVDTHVPVPASAFDGTGREMGVRVNLGVELTPRIQLTAVPHAYRVDRVASAELDDVIDLGAPGTIGTLNVYSSAVGGGRINTYGGDGQEQIRLWGESWGELLLMDSDATNDRTVLLSAGANTGGFLNLYSATAAIRASMNGSTAGANFILYDSAASPSVSLRGDLGGRIDAEESVNVQDAIGGITLASMRTFASGGNFYGFDETGLQVYAAGASASVGGFVNMNQGNGVLTINLDGDATNANGGGQLTIHQADGGVGMVVDGDSGGSGLLQVYGATTPRIQVDGDAGALTSGAVRVSSNGDRVTAELVGTEPLGPSGGGLVLYNDNATTNARTVIVDGSLGGGTNGGGILLFDSADGTVSETIRLDADDAGGGTITLRNPTGVAVITLDGNSAGDGRITTQELVITGGSDLSEQFDVQAAGGDVKPGMVVCIDPKNPGKLMASSKAYDRTVAGVISGAGGVKPGMMMGQSGTIADGTHPVALTGRVFCLADAGSGSIEAGDLLTTSPVPGHAMKVTDHAKAQGAILGKAMTPLAEGRGMVLILVTLQ